MGVQGARSHSWFSHAPSHPPVSLQDSNFYLHEDFLSSLGPNSTKVSVSSSFYFFSPLVINTLKYAPGNCPSITGHHHWVITLPFSLYNLIPWISFLIFCSLLKPLKYGVCLHHFIKTIISVVTNNLYIVKSQGHLSVYSMWPPIALWQSFWTISSFLKVSSSQVLVTITHFVSLLLLFPLPCLWTPLFPFTL